MKRDSASAWRIGEHQKDLDKPVKRLVSRSSNGSGRGSSESEDESQNVSYQTTENSWVPDPTATPHAKLPVGAVAWLG